MTFVATMLSFCSETILFLVTAVLLLIVAFGKNDSATFKLNKSVTKLLTSPATNQSFARGVRDVTDVQGFWAWMRHDFASLMFAQQQQENSGSMRVANSHVIGAINIRQHRVTSQPCDAPAVLRKHLPAVCRPSFSRKHRATDEFGSGNNTWSYFRQNEASGSRITGRHAKYKGDGYLVVLDLQK